MEENIETDQRITNPADSLPEISMEHLSSEMREACNHAGWKTLTPVQSKSIPYFLAGRDMMVQSRTGSGKTGAYILPIIQKINAQENNAQALVLVPTRELALQVSKEAQMLTQGTLIKTVVVYGGVGYNAQLEAFRSGAQIVIGTPGRILDHLLKIPFAGSSEDTDFRRSRPHVIHGLLSRHGKNP